MYPAVQFLGIMLRGRIAKARREEGGASAVEWVVIAGIVLAICIAVGVIISKALKDKATDVGTGVGTSDTTGSGGNGNN